jgi:hypothetical protein
MIAHLISHYAIFEALYLHDQLQSTPGLRTALVELYTAALQYLSKAKRYYGQNTLGMLKNLTRKLIALNANQNT